MKFIILLFAIAVVQSISAQETPTPSGSESAGKDPASQPGSGGQSSVSLSGNNSYLKYIQDFFSNSSVKIVGGQKAKHGAYPFMVSLHRNRSDIGFVHSCGAAVLNENWVITAVHCLPDNKLSRYQILVGLHKLSKRNAPTVQRINISKIVQHKEYDAETWENDIALLRTTRPIDIAGSDGYVNSIHLPKTDKDPTGNAKVIGWGHTYKGSNKTSDTLREVVVPIIPRDVCKKADKYVFETNICAGIAYRDSCQLDSGEPLFQTDSRGVATLIGIVSHGIGCGKPGFPGVYTKVSSYMDWMQKIMSK